MATDKRELVSARVTPEVHQILRIAMAFEHVTSMQHVLEPVITRFAEEYVQDPDIAVAVAALRRRGAKKGGLVVPLRAGELGTMSPKRGAQGRRRRSAVQGAQSDA